MEQPGNTPKRRLAIGLIAGIAVLAAGWLLVRNVGRAAPVTAAAAGSASVIPSGYLVEVLNATPKAGLARQVTRLLRERGVDVIYVGTSTDGADSTTVLIRRGDAKHGNEVGRLLGIKRVLSRPDPKPRVDVTVVVGSDFRFPKGWFPL